MSSDKRHLRSFTATTRSEHNQTVFWIQGLDAWHKVNFQSGERMQSQTANVKNVKLAIQQLALTANSECCVRAGSLQSTRVHAVFGGGVDLTEKLKDAACSYVGDLPITRTPNHTQSFLLARRLNEPKLHFLRCSCWPIDTLCHQIYPGPDLSALLVSRMKT